jgi:predicted nucleotide-binding protein (sugar kinase/HSP70/actin superfamily)
MNKAGQNVISEQTLLPISLVVTIVMGSLGLAGIYYKVQSTERRQDYVEVQFEKERDAIVLEIRELKKQQIEMDKKLDRLLIQGGRAR